MNRNEIIDLAGTILHIHHDAGCDWEEARERTVNDIMRIIMESQDGIINAAKEG